MKKTTTKIKACRNASQLILVNLNLPIIQAFLKTEQLNICLAQCFPVLFLKAHQQNTFSYHF